jgi:hypothetical protein
MDERLRNLMRDRGHGDLCLEVDDPDLEGRTLDVLRRLRSAREEMAPDLGRCVVANLRRMARMGLFLEEEMTRRFDGFRGRQGLVSWEHYLPPLPPELTRLVDRHDSAAAAAVAPPALAR